MYIICKNTITNYNYNMQYHIWKVYFFWISCHLFCIFDTF